MGDKGQDKDALFRVYIGKGAYLPGIPAGNLTRGQYDDLTDAQRAAVDNGSIYRRAPGVKDQGDSGAAPDSPPAEG